MTDPGCYTLTYRDDYGLDSDGWNPKPIWRRLIRCSLWTCKRVKALDENTETHCSGDILYWIDVGD